MTELIVENYDGENKVINDIPVGTFFTGNFQGYNFLGSIIEVNNNTANKFYSTILFLKNLDESNRTSLGENKNQWDVEFVGEFFISNYKEISKVTFSY